MKKTLCALVLALSMGYLFSGCTGKAGPDGPQGPPGGTGVTNLSFYIATVDTTFWIPQLGMDSDSFNSTNIYISALYSVSSPDYHIEAYYSLNSSTGPWTAMPSVGVFWGSSLQQQNDTLLDELGYIYQTGNPGFVNLTYKYIEIPSRLRHFHTLLHHPRSPVYMMVAVVPGTVMKKHPATDWKNAVEVMQLPEAKRAIYKNLSESGKTSR